MEEKIILTRGGVYLAKLNPAKSSEVGKVRPVIILTSQKILDFEPPIVFICPLSSKSYDVLLNIHLKLEPRDNLEVESFALVEHCRSISLKRIIYPRIAQITEQELKQLLNKLQHLLDFC